PGLGPLYPSPQRPVEHRPTEAAQPDVNACGEKSHATGGSHAGPEEGDGNAVREERAEVRDRSDSAECPGPPELVEAERAKATLHEVGRERHAEAAAAGEPAQHVVVGEVIGNRLEAADGAEGVPSAGNGRAEGMAEPLEAGPDEGGRQEPLIDEHGIEPRGDI